MPSYSSLSLPQSRPIPSLPFLPLPLPLPLLHSHSHTHPLPSSPPSASASTPQPPPLSTEPPPPPHLNHVASFLSTLLNLTNRSPRPSHTPISPTLHSPSSLYPSIMKSLSSSGRPDLSLLLFLSLPSPPSPQLLSSFLHSLYLLQQPHLLYSSLSSLLPSFCSRLSPATSTVLLTSLSNLSNSAEAAYSAFLSIKKPDSIAFGALITMLCKAGHIEDALGVFDLMLERGLRPTTRACTSIMKAYCVEGRLREAQRFLQAMENGTGGGLLPRPDAIMYTVYIEGFYPVLDIDSCFCFNF